MKLNKLLAFIPLTLVLILCCNMVFATDICDNNLTQSENAISSDSNHENLLKDSSKSNTIIIEEDKENSNQILNPTIQPAIDSANPGDTIILKGDFAHCHFTVNKTINIIGYDATLWSCPHYQSEGAGSFGVFYITEGGNGSVFNGITFKNNARAQNPFAFLIRGASNISINDCTIDYPEEPEYKFQGIVIENSNNVKLSNSIIKNTINGIKITDSFNVDIKECTLTNNENQAIEVSGNSSRIDIFYNSITNNAQMGIRLSAADYININNNLIKGNGLNNAEESGSGIYVNCNITKLTVNGNFFLNNDLHAILYDCRCRNLNNENGADELTIVDNNYFQGHNSMILHHRIYVERANGNMAYDAEKDIFYPADNGNYYEGKSYVYMRQAFIFHDVPCGFTYYTTDIPWSLEAPLNNGKYDFSLKLQINEVKKGIYQLSIVNSTGGTANDFNSGYITFFLNNYSTVEPQRGDVYRKSKIENGIAIADFREEYSNFKSSDNVIVAVFPGLSSEVIRNPYISYNVSDSNIPKDSQTSLVPYKLTTYPLSEEYFSAKLIDSNNNPIAGQIIVFKFDGKSYTAITDNKGIAMVKVNLFSKKTYNVSLSYPGSDDFKASSADSQIIVKTGSKKSKIKASNLKVKKNKKKTFKLKLTASNGKALSNQKVLVKLNGKQHILKTNNKGIAKISVKLKKVKKYKIEMQYLGNSMFKGISKTKTITVIKK